MGPVPGENRDRSPHNEDQDLENVSGDVIMPPDLSASGSEDEDADDSHGYMPLPQDYQELDASHSSDEDDSENDGDVRETSAAPQTAPSGSNLASGVSQAHSMYSPGKTPSHLQVPDMPRPTEKELLWNQPRQEKEKALVMDDDRVAQVKAAMAGFRLPDSSVPSWARSLSDDAWKQQLLSRLHTNSGSSAARAVSHDTPSDSSVPSGEKTPAGSSQ